MAANETSVVLVTGVLSMYLNVYERCVTGFFDILHPGHLAFFDHAARLGD